VTSVTEVRRPGRPRSESAERAIIDAVLALVAEGGVDALSVEGVAAKAGVGKGTIYRRWSSKEAMLVDALASVTETLPDEIEGRSVRDELVALVDTIRSSSQDTPAGRLLPRVIAAATTHPQVMREYRARVVERRSERLRTVLRRGVSTGELRADLDLDTAVTLIVGPMLYLVMMKSQPGTLDHRTAEALVDGVLTGLSGRSAPASGS
jgi:AcrR family transcriptional regulator